MKLTSSAFSDGGEIPRRFTCEGEGLSPPLVFHDIPPGAKSLALIVDDPDAPDPKAPKRRWVHWVLFNLPPTTSGLNEAIATHELPKGTQQGLNDWKRTGYGGPCPPIGRHRYFHALYALDVLLPAPSEPLTRDGLLGAMDGHILEKAELMGTYQKQGKG